MAGSEITTEMTAVSNTLMEYLDGNSNISHCKQCPGRKALQAQNSRTINSEYDPSVLEDGNSEESKNEEVSAKEGRRNTDQTNGKIL